MPTGFFSEKARLCVIFTVASVPDFLHTPVKFRQVAQSGGAIFGKTLKFFWILAWILAAWYNMSIIRR